MKKTLPSLLLAFLLAACGPKFGDLLDSEDNVCFESGDIIVSNSGSGAVVALDADGVFKRVVYSTNPAAEKPWGLSWLQSTQELLIAVGNNRVVAVSASDCTSRIVASDINLTGNLRGVTVLTGGDMLIAEANNIERFTPSSPTWTRVGTGGWPLAAQTTPTGLSQLSNGGFVHCSTGTDVVRTYNAAGTQTATRASGIAGTTDATDCYQLDNGNIVTVWNGTTDTVSIYNLALSSSLFTYSNLAILPNPGGVGQKANGNIVVTERTNHYIVELTSTGTYVQTLAAGTVLSTPEHIKVIP